MLAWTWMKLGTDVLPQVYICMWGDNSCSINFAGVMALDTYNFYTFSTSPFFNGFEWNLAGLLHHKSRFSCEEIIHVWEILQFWPLSLRNFHGFEWNLAGLLHHKSRFACGEIIHVWQNLQELWLLTLRIFFSHFNLSSQLLHSCMDLNWTWQECCTTSLGVHMGR